MKDHVTREKKQPDSDEIEVVGYRPEDVIHCLPKPELDLTNYVPDPDKICPKTNLLTPWGPSIWFVDGPIVSFYGYSYSTRMVVVSLSQGGGSLIWSPIPLSNELANEIEGRAGGVRHIVAPNMYHNRNLKEWSDRYPLAKIHAAPGLPEREGVGSEDLIFDFLLTDDIHRDLSLDLDQVLFRGSYCDEAVLYHRLSGTIIFADLIQRHYECNCTGMYGEMMRLNGVVGEQGGTPKPWRLSFWWNGNKKKAQNALHVILDRWKPKMMIVAHGENSTEGATDLVANALSWMTTSDI